MRRLVPATLLLVVLAAPVLAQVVTIDQAKAMAGNITPGDAPGFPVTLSRAGSYVLSGHLDVPTGVNGMEITAADVSLNLNGFSLRGPVQCQISGPNYTCGSDSDANTYGILASNEAPRLRVHNGSVRGFVHRGIYLAGASIVERVHISDMRRVGVLLTGGSQLIDSTVTRIASTGVMLAGGQVHRSVFQTIGGRGIEAYTLAGSSVFDSRFTAMPQAIQAMDALGRLMLGGNVFQGASAISGSYVVSRPNLCEASAC